MHYSHLYRKKSVGLNVNVFIIILGSPSFVLEDYGTDFFTASASYLFQIHPAITNAFNGIELFQ